MERKLLVGVARIYKEKYRGTVCQTLELCDRMTLVLGSANASRRRELQTDKCCCRALIRRRDTWSNGSWRLDLQEFLTSGPEV